MQALATAWVAKEGEFDSQPGEDLLFARAVRMNADSKWTLEIFCVSNPEYKSIKSKFSPVSSFGDQCMTPDDFNKFYEARNKSLSTKTWQEKGTIYAELSRRIGNKEVSKAVAFIFDPDQPLLTPKIMRAILRKH